MSYKEVKELRKNGQLDDALSMAMQDMANDPDNVWCKRSLFWVLYEYLKKDALNGDVMPFFDNLKKIQELELLNIPEESIARTNVFRCIKWFLKKISSGKDLQGINGIADKLFTFAQSFETPKPSEEYSEMIDAFLKVAEVWNGFIGFVEQWVFSHFRQDDYHERSIIFPDGKIRRYMSLAECAYIAYTKAIMKVKDMERMRSIQPTLDQLADRKGMDFLGYFNAKLLLSLNADKDDVLEEVMPFVRKKSNDFWVWQFLSEVFIEDEEKYLACLLRATHCRTKEEYLPNIRKKLVEYYYQREDFPRLKQQLDRYVRFRLEHGYALDSKIQQIMGDSRIESATQDASDPIDYMKITDNIIGKVESKRIEFEGDVVTNKAGTVLFVKSESLFALIPAKKALGLSKGDKVRALAEESYDKKRKTNGWVCVKVTKI